MCQHEQNKWNLISKQGQKKVTEEKKTSQAGLQSSELQQRKEELGKEGTPRIGDGWAASHQNLLIWVFMGRNDRGSF